MVLGVLADLALLARPCVDVLEDVVVQRAQVGEVEGSLDQLGMAFEFGDSDGGGVKLELA